MADYAQRYADKQADKLSRKIAKTYAQAAKEINGEMTDFWSAHKVKSDRMLQDVAEGKITKKDYQDWLKNQVFQGDRWQRKLDEMARAYMGADERAREMLGETTKDVFTESGNYQAYKTGIDVNGAVSFDMYDRKTVDRLIKDDPQILPEWKIDKPKDYQWNYKRVNNAVTQGILQGESVYDIGRRLTVDLSAQNASKMDMFARTAVTGAQNAGRIERLHEAEEMGIKVKKRWLAIKDNKTRDAHGDLDGVEKDIDEPFHNEFGDIDYPGDPSADPANVYNCRCTLIYVYPEYKDKQHFENHETYAEWKERNRQEAQEKTVVKPVAEQIAKETHRVAQGQDISKTWKRREDQFDFEIEDVINAQGFDGKPRVVDADEFDNAVQESGFIAQRTYSAPDQETLDAYRQQLYEGKWYVDCSSGRASHGQGMYVSANYDGKLTEGIQNDMRGYSSNSSHYYIETMTLTPDARIIKEEEISRLKRETAKDYANNILKESHPEYTENERLIYEYSVGIIDRENNEKLDMYIENDREAALAFLNKHEENWSQEAKIAREAERHIRNMDNGSFATLLGYDAISADGYGESGNFTVILNRTKVIFRRPDND